jgi:hypothetical protein
MFKVTCFVEDRNLSLLLHRLTGIAKNVEPVPVADIMARPRQIVTGDQIDLMRKWLVKHNKTRVVAEDIRTFRKAIGLSEEGYGYALKMAREAGLLVQHNTGNGHTTAYYDVKLPSPTPSATKSKEKK